MKQTSADVDRTRLRKLWKELAPILDHTLVVTLTSGLAFILMALFHGVRNWLNFSGLDAVWLVLRWTEFAILVIIALFYLTALARIVFISADRILKDVRGSKE
jgi:hypothetical protein